MLNYIAFIFAGIMGTEIGSASADMIEQYCAEIGSEVGGDEAPHILGRIRTHAQTSWNARSPR